MDILKQIVGNKATILAVPVTTPAGGLVRVIGSTGIQLLDSSYPGGTAACSLLTKMKWKLSPKDVRGPPPFKAPPPMPWSEKVAAALTFRVFTNQVCLQITNLLDGLANEGFSVNNGAKVLHALYRLLTRAAITQVRAFSPLMMQRPPVKRS